MLLDQVLDAVVETLSALVDDQIVAASVYFLV
jgi:hypothetical protein